MRLSTDGNEPMPAQSSVTERNYVRTLVRFPVDALYLTLCLLLLTINYYLPTRIFLLTWLKGLIIDVRIQQYSFFGVYASVACSELQFYPCCPLSYRFVALRSQIALVIPPPNAG